MIAEIGMETKTVVRLPLFERRVLSLAMIFLALTGLSSVDCDECSLPATWDGKWFINAMANSPPILINSTSNTISRIGTDPAYALGTCIWRKGDLYIFKDGGNCNKCVIMYAKHKNVLQSRENEAMECENELDFDDENGIESQCHDKLSASGQHYSWFRNDYKPSDCPFRDTTLQFSYRNSERSNCTSPISHASSCLDRTKLQLQYEACHDVANSEGKIQDLTCLGDWMEGGYQYFVADVVNSNSQSHASLNDRLRCFVFKEVVVPNSLPSKSDVTIGYEVGISDAATCQDLHNPESGGTILHMNIENHLEFNAKPCSFPSWFASHNWMDMEKTVEFHLNPLLKNRSIHIIPKPHHHVTPNLSQFHQRQQQQSSRKASFFPLSHSNLVCMHTKNISVGDDNHVAVIGKYTVGCKIGEICLHLIRRSEYLLQFYYLEQGDLTSESFRENCFSSAIPNLQKGATMISTKGRKKECPNPGNYTIINATMPSTNQSIDNLFSVKERNWVIGCNLETVVEVQLSPNNFLEEHFSCMDGWEENNLTYTVLGYIADSEQISNSTTLSCMISEKFGDSYAETKVVVATEDCILNDVSRINSTEDEGDNEGHMRATSHSPDTTHPHNYIELRKFESCISADEPAKDESSLDADSDDASQLKQSGIITSASAITLPKIQEVFASITSILVYLFLFQ
ncbi:unnamed protein product [Orchesella dallaii]|uniref:Uncharacterized protein n=1 Tax=Orchesella dallaii TaxID=48710 RepID=A0ABP1Q4K9_9HEXA